jgi:deazaflavin-dependent oxidoreductase (nitroreductase family)
MSESTGTVASWNEVVIQQFKAGEERIAGMFDRSALLLLHTRGAKSGELRTSPVAYFTFDDRIVIVASAAGADKHPAWYFNLLANPEVTIERWQDDALESVTAKAEPIEGPERDRLWGEITSMAPGFAEYELKTSRVIPLVALRRL